MRVTSLHTYPVKGMRALACDTVQVEPRGLAHDRRWLVVDEQGRFLTQRECPDLAQFSATPISGGLTITSPRASIDCMAPIGDVRLDVQVWNDEVSAVAADGNVSAWLSEALGRPVRLVYMDDNSVRSTSGNWGKTSPVSFADGYPVLFALEASLGALNDAIVENAGSAIGMERFRPNIVVEGAAPWADDFWSVVRVGNVVFDLVRPCTRCIVTTLDQTSGEKSGREPLRTLSQLRKSAHPDVDGVLFGWNAVPRSGGEIKAGDRVEVLERRNEGWPLASP